MIFIVLQIKENIKRNSGRHSLFILLKMRKMPLKIHKMFKAVIIF